VKVTVKDEHLVITVNPISHSKRFLDDAVEAYSCDLPRSLKKLLWAIDVAGVEGVDVELHLVFVVEPLEELQIGQRLRLGGTFIPVADPREILGA